MAHRNVAAAGLIHIRARQNSYYSAAPAAAFLAHSPALSLSLSPSHGVAVQVTSITRTLNARRVPTSTSFCSPRNRCEIYLDSNIAAEIPTYCRVLNYSVPQVSQRVRLNYASAIVACFPIGSTSKLCI